MVSLFKSVLPALTVGFLLGVTFVNAETVRFGTIDFEPYVLKNDKFDRRGFMVDINWAIAERSGITITDSVLPIARLIKNMQNDATDCTIMLLTSWNKEQFIPVAEVFDHFDTIVITSKDVKINKIIDLEGHMLALPRGSYKGFSISTNPNIQRHQTDSYTQSAKLLQAGRVDAIVGTALSLYHILEQLNVKKADIGSSLVFDSKPVWLHCARNQVSAEYITLLRQATNALRVEGVFQDIFDAYYPLEFR